MVSSSKKSIKRPSTANTVEGIEHENINLANELARKQLEDGSATSQIITHFLKEGSIRSQIELEKIRYEIELLKARKEALESTSRLEELYANAIEAMKKYSGYFGQSSEEMVELDE